MTTEPTPTDATSTSITGQAPTPAIETPPPVVAETPPAWPLKVDIAILALLLILSFFLASFAATNSELWMHLAIGKRISEGKFEFGVDPYSWATEAFAGKPAVYWVHHGWLYSWLVFQLYSLFGGMGLVVAKAILFTVAIFLLSRIGWREQNRWFLLICLVMAALAASQRLLLQPMVVSLLFLSITLLVLHRVGVFAEQRETPGPDRSRWLWCLPALFALWANFDDWFILGPLLLALCWGATGLARWYPSGNPVPGRTIGIVFGVGLLACLLNPHHWHVFQLPTELAYVVVSIGDSVGIRLPDALVAAGRSVKEFSRFEPNTTLTLSALSSHYWQNAYLGMNVAGIAFYPLLLLGLVAFTLMALIKPGSNAPALQVSRFLPWLAFAVLALALYRLIPFFVLIAAPLTAMTLGEFLLWQQTSNEVAASRRDRGLHLARLVSLPFLLLLLYLAWPGWLHGTAGGNEFSAPRRVAWEIRPDGSARAAAEALHALQEQQQAGHVFNFSRDMANYLPWYAPGVKYFLDGRIALYPGQAATFDKARQALVDTNLPAADWQKLFQERGIDQIVVVNFMADPSKAAGTKLAQKYKSSLLRWWLDAEHWQQRYGDLRTLVLSWAGPNKSWPTNSAIEDINRQAFGPIAADQRPPARGTSPPRTQDIWSLYRDGIPPLPARVDEIRLRHERYLLADEWLNRKVRPDGIVFMTSSLPWLGNPLLIIGALDFQMKAGQFVPPLDRGPPALPILMVRDARRAVEENPLDAGTHVALRIANETLRSEQGYWVQNSSPSSPYSSFLRDRLRQTQLIASAFHAVQLQPDNPEHHQLLADLYLKENLRDLALEHFQMAMKGYQTRMASGYYNVKNPKEQEAVLKQYREKLVDPLERTVRERMLRFKEGTDKLTSLQKANFALGEQFKEFRGTEVETTPLGLGKKALDLLTNIDPKTLSKEEQLVYLLIQFDLLLAMGHVDILAANLKVENVRNALPPFRRAQYQLFTAGAWGDYHQIDEALSEIEKGLRQGIGETIKKIDEKRQHSVVTMFVGPPLLSPSLVSVAATVQCMPFGYSAEGKLTVTPLGMINNERGQLGTLHNDLFNTITLRGISALEAGETSRARVQFQAVLTEAGDTHFFTDRPIAKRYVDLLNEQRR